MPQKHLDHLVHVYTQILVHSATEPRVPLHLEALLPLLRRWNEGLIHHKDSSLQANQDKSNVTG